MGRGGIPITIKPVGILLVVSAIPYFTGGMRVRGIALGIVVVVLLTWITEQALLIIDFQGNTRKGSSTSLSAFIVASFFHNSPLISYSDKKSHTI